MRLLFSTLVAIFVIRYVASSSPKQLELQNAIISSDLAEVKRVLSDPEMNPGFNNNNEAILFACFKGYNDIVEKLLEDRKIDPNQALNTVIESPLEFNRREIFKLFLWNIRLDPYQAVRSLVDKKVDLDTFRALLNNSGFNLDAAYCF